jgi:YhcH/YjgK/YiaL family protein
MIYGKLSEFEKLIPGTLPEALTRSLQWLRSLSAGQELGRYELDETTGLYAMVMRYQTVPAEESRYESHRRAVDLQYTIEGGEGIEWAHTNDLAANGGYEDDRDLQFYLPGEPGAFVKNLPGCFSIYTPTDAHRPKIIVPGHTEVFKAVVKIPLSSFLD